MSRFAQIGSVISDRPLEWLFYLVAAIYVLVVLTLGMGWAGFGIGLVVIAFFGRFYVSHIRRYPRFKLSEIGTIEMDVAAGSTSGLSVKVMFGIFITLSVVQIFIACAEGFAILVSRIKGVSADLDVRLFVEQVVLAAGNVAVSYIVYRNLWRRLVITDQGLFQVLDVTRPWPTNRPLDEPHSPSRAMQLYRWEQVARFHWSQGRGKHTLHLNVRQPSIRVPQLVSYKFPELSDERWQQLDQLLRKHVAETDVVDPGRDLTTSAV